MISQARTFRGGEVKCRSCTQVITLKTKGHLANNPNPICGGCYLLEKKKLRKQKGER